MLSTEVLSRNGIYYNISTHNGHFKVTGYREYFKGMFMAENGDVAELDSYRECLEYIEERSKLYETVD